jgi:FtsH-binding integral membrane protein
MATVSQSASAYQGVHFSGRNGLVDKYFYFAMSLLVAAIVVWGFSHTADQNLLHAAPPRPLILWFHAAAFSAWVLFFIFQSTLVRTHNVKWHRFFGWFGAGLGTAMVLLGVTTAIIMGRFDTYVKHEPGSDAFLIVPFFDVAAFATLFGLAVLWRKKPEFHRRLIFIATCGLLDATFGRNDYIFNHNLFFWCLDGVILLGVVRDLVVNRRIHKVYLVSLPILIACQVFVVHTYASASAWWVRIADRVLG